ncbi:MAG: hypothetical protein JXA21_28715 [Anaerolineae bacterium]|nr:hypothetical protein [Anaerolineae bacterium]
MRQNLQAMLPFVSPEKAQEIRHMLARAEESVAYAAAHDDIDAAAKEMAPHFDEYKEYVADERQAMALAERLFAEEPFRPLWFSAGDVERAFAEVGQPRPRSHELRDHDVELVIEAITFLARDRDWRVLMAQRLLRIMVDYARAGRYLEAWMIQYSSYLMVEKPGTSSPFLFEMFHHGFSLWSGQLRDEQSGLLEVIGLDPEVIKSMAPDEAAALVREAASDPAKVAAMETYFADHPEMTEKGKADILNVEHEALGVLVRRDAQRFLLPRGDMAPYISAAMKEAMSLVDAIQQGPDALDHDQFLDTLGEALMKQAKLLARDMFTPDRVVQLADDLKAYAQELQDAGEQDDAFQVRTVQLLLRNKESPDSTPFLIGLGYLSLRVAALELEEQAQQPADTSGQEVL